MSQHGFQVHWAVEALVRASALARSFLFAFLWFHPGGGVSKILTHEEQKKMEERGKEKALEKPPPFTLQVALPPLELDGKLPSDRHPLPHSHLRLS